MSEIQATQKRPVLARIFLSPEEPRLRTVWRILIQFLLAFLLVAVFGTALGIAGKSLGLGANLSFVLNGIVEFIAFTASIYAARRWLDKRSFESLGLRIDRQALPDVLTGIGITFVQMGFIYVVMLKLGWLTFEGFAWKFDPIPAVIAGVLAFFAGFIFIGWSEELLSRGYQLQNIASSTNLFWGAVLSSAIFGFLHIFNPGANTVSTVGIFFAGIYLAYAYLRTKQLWLSIGLHIGWNFFEGVVFGFPVSGLSEIYKLLRIKVHGPELWTGGAFGPEAGLIVLPSLIVGGALIYLYTLRRAK